MNDALRAAIQRDDSVEVEHNGLSARLHPPRGEKAVEYIADAKKMIPSDRVRPYLNGKADPPADIQVEIDDIEKNTLGFVAKWIGPLMEEEGISPTDAWRAFLALGGAAGPVVPAMADLVGSCIGLPDDRVEAVPTLPPARPE